MGLTARRKEPFEHFWGLPEFQGIAVYIPGGDKLERFKKKQKLKEK